MAADVLYLNEEKEWYGLWWLEGEYQNQLSGVLRYAPDSGLRLTLIGHLGEEIGNEPEVFPVIHGISGQREITLLHGFSTRSTAVFGSRSVKSDRQDIWGVLKMLDSH